MPHARKRRVLAIAHNFPPAASIGTMRPLRLVKRLSAQEWDVTVLMASPRTYAPGTPIDTELIAKVPQDVELLHANVIRIVPTAQRVGTALRRVANSATPSATTPANASTAEGHPPARYSFLKRAYATIDELTTIPDKEAGWIVPAVATGWAHILRRRPDVIYSTAPPWTAQIVALALARLTRVPWVADFRDPWARAPWRETQPERIRRASIACERRVVQRADAIIFATQTNRDEYAAFYGPDLARKFHIVPNGCDVDDFAALPAQRVDDGFVMVHAGSLYGARSPVPLFHAIAAAFRDGAIAREHFRLRLIGAAADARFPAVAAELGLSDVVEFVPRMKRQDVIAAMASASCLLVLQPGTTVSIPGKLYEYFAVGRPILSLSEEGELSDLVRRSGIGIAAVPHDALAIEAALRQVVALARDVTLPRVPAELYDGHRTAAQAATILREVADSSSPHVSRDATDPDDVNGHHARVSAPSRGCRS
jgi:glycosyltransferase involved in cell wall biosynthesis